MEQDFSPGLQSLTADGTIMAYGNQERSEHQSAHHSEYHFRLNLGSAEILSQSNRLSLHMRMSILISPYYSVGTICSCTSRIDYMDWEDCPAQDDGIFADLHEGGVSSSGGRLCMAISI